MHGCLDKGDDVEKQKLNLCECGCIPELNRYDNLSADIKCKCGLFVQFYLKKSNDSEVKLIEWWNEKHPIENKESMISTDQVKPKDSDNNWNLDIKLLGPDGAEIEDNDTHKIKAKFICQPTPNCGICEWSMSNSDLSKWQCMAQGFKLCAVCYNTDECKKLFKEESDD